ncbi:MAG TPA: hypothetical protein VMU83_00870 [Hanamia sp.]|nr:hypothetical protein [Hanamia sp.]
MNFCGVITTINPESNRSHLYWIARAGKDPVKLFNNIQVAILSGP